ncbi:sushi, von Willebrand factor type A, EGF and pentraxin domain-containing protein 1-like [Tubulanus polymorphus]|uniref:sushi, von Willebrand factor type A, EGF and pentraxin domain-containing protein 1-like n=1 Tax=Tubulanus polymorphus TaxID=672921 RepID=UPI003DA4F6DF
MYPEILLSRVWEVEYIPVHLQFAKVTDDCVLKLPDHVVEVERNVKTRYKPLETVSLACESGYALSKGHLNLKCSFSGKWRGVLPKCSSKSEAVNKVSFLLSGADYKGSLSTTIRGYSCQYWNSSSPHAHKFQTAGSHFTDSNVDDAQNYCRNPTDSDSAFAFCFTTDPDVKTDYCLIRKTDVSCGPPLLAPNTRVVGQKSFLVGDRIEVECDPGFTAISGNAHINCLQNGKYDKEPVECIEIMSSNTCEPLELPAGVMEVTGHQLSHYSHGSIVTLTCSKGFYMDPSDNATSVKCQGGTQWIGHPLYPRCYPENVAVRRCRITNDGIYYVGNVSTSSSGIPCQRWAIDSPHSHRFHKDYIFTDGSAQAASNYCRRPKISTAKYVWCYTTSIYKRFEKCDVPRCYISCGLPETEGGNSTLISPISQYKEGSEARYNCNDGYHPFDGDSVRVCTASGDFTGKPLHCLGRDEISSCTLPELPEGVISLRGKSSYSHGEEEIFICDASYYQIDGDSYAYKTCYGGELWSSGFPKCYAKDEAVKQCITNPPRGTEYMGTVSVTRSGFTCQAWASQTPVKHSLTWGPWYPERDVNAAKNYCRNPASVYGRIWCYTLNSEVKRESCDVPVCKRSCGVPEPGTNTIITDDYIEYFVGDTVNYVCIPDFDHVSGSRNRVCDVDGFFKDEPPVSSTAEAPCPVLVMPGVTVNDNRIYNSGEKAFYSCKSGYILLNQPSEVTCYGDDLWIKGQLPQCIEFLEAENYCRLPTKNWVYRGSQSKTDTGDTCMEWTSDTPTVYHTDSMFIDGSVVAAGNKCRNPDETSCGEPELGTLATIANPSRLGWYAGSTVKYRCGNTEAADTVHVSGDLDRVCQWDGTLSGSLPNCRVNGCLNPEPGIGSELVDVNKVHYNTGEHAEYRCKISTMTVVSGETDRTCLSDGSFGSTPPHCVEAVTECIPEAGISAIVTNKTKQYFEGDFVEYECSGSGYALLSGSLTRQCLKSGNFTDNPPACSVTCTVPFVANSMNSHAEGSPVFPGDELMFTCAHGYTSDDQLSMTCQIDGSWSSLTPRCKEIILVRCEEPTDLAGIHIVNDSNTVYHENDTIAFECDEFFFQPEDDRSRTCQSDGKWNDLSPLCYPITCIPGEIPNAYELESYYPDYWVGEFVYYSCDVNYYLEKGMLVGMCAPSGEIIFEDPPVCSEIRCYPEQGVSVRILNSTDRFVVGDEIHYRCIDETFETVSTTSLMKRTCLRTGLFSGVVPTCLEKCVLPALPDGVVPSRVKQRYSLGEQVKIQCAPGYFIKGDNKIITCVTGNEWDAVNLPTCYAKADAERVCIISPLGAEYIGTTEVTETGQPCKRWAQHSPAYNDNQFPDGSVESADNYCRNPSLIHAAPWCHVDDSSYIRDWNYCDIPYCTRICGKPNEGTNTHIISDEADEYRVGDTVFHECLDGYELVRGSLKQECSLSSLFEPASVCLPSNLKSNCTRPTDLPDELTILNSKDVYMSGEMAFLSCGIGFKLIGPDNIQCFGGDDWKYTEYPKCAPTPYAAVRTCRISVVGSEYLGNVSETKRGTPCQRWDSHVPHAHKQWNESYYFPDDTMEEVADHCRNGYSAASSPWCLTTDPNMFWDHCNIPLCPVQSCGALIDDQIKADIIDRKIEYLNDDYVEYVCESCPPPQKPSYLVSKNDKTFYEIGEQEILTCAAGYYMQGEPVYISCFGGPDVTKIWTNYSVYPTCYSGNFDS